MSAALDLYAKPTATTDDKERARPIADAFDTLEARFPQLNDRATQGHLRESELRLQNEITGVELQIRENEARLQEQPLPCVHREAPEAPLHPIRRRTPPPFPSICTAPARST